MGYLTQISASNIPKTILNQSWQYLKDSSSKMQENAIELGIIILSTSILQKIFGNKKSELSNKPEEATNSAWEDFKNRKWELVNRSVGWAFSKQFVSGVITQRFLSLVSSALQCPISLASTALKSSLPLNSSDLQRFDLLCKKCNDFIPIIFQLFITYRNFIEIYKNSDEDTDITGINVLKRLINHREYQAGLVGLGMIVRDQFISHLVKKIFPSSANVLTNLAVAFIASFIEKFMKNHDTDEEQRTETSGTEEMAHFSI